MRFLTLGVIVIGISIFPIWLLWLTYCYVMQSVWSAGPVALIDPSFWIFLATWLLIGAVGGLFRSEK